MWVLLLLALDRRPRERMERLRAARRHALGHRPAHRRGHRPRHPGHRHVARRRSSSAGPFRVGSSRTCTRCTSWCSRRAPRVRGAARDRGVAARPAAVPRPRAARRAERRRRRPACPTAAARAGGLFLVVTGLLLLISATVTVSPIWLYGPADPGNAGRGQPARLVHRVPRRGAAPRAARLGARVARAHVDAGDPRARWPSSAPSSRSSPPTRSWRSGSRGDRGDHHLLDRPRHAPTRTGLGVAGLVFVGRALGRGERRHHRRRRSR